MIDGEGDTVPLPTVTVLGREFGAVPFTAAQLAPPSTLRKRR